MTKKIITLFKVTSILLALLCLTYNTSFAGESYSSKNTHNMIHLNLNTATQMDIARIINALIGIDLCHKITGYRKTNNGFKKIEDLKKIEGVDEKIYKKIVENVTLEI